MGKKFDFTKTSCFIYLTSPILAASRGGQAYEVPLHRFVTNKKSRRNNTDCPNCDKFNKQILEATNKASTYVPDIATRWYACHLKQLQQAEQRQSAKEARELAFSTFNEAMQLQDRQKSLLLKYNTIPICNFRQTRSMQQLQRSVGGEDLRKCKIHNACSPCTEGKKPIISPEFEKLLRHNEQRQNENLLYGSSYQKVSKQCNNNVKPALLNSKAHHMLGSEAVEKKCLKVKFCADANKAKKNRNLNKGGITECFKNGKEAFLNLLKFKQCETKECRAKSVEEKKRKQEKNAPQRSICPKIKYQANGEMKPNCKCSALNAKPELRKKDPIVLTCTGKSVARQNNLLPKGYQVKSIQKNNKEERNQKGEVLNGTTRSSMQQTRASLKSTKDNRISITTPSNTVEINTDHRASTESLIPLRH